MLPDSDHIKRRNVWHVATIIMKSVLPRLVSKKKANRKHDLCRSYKYVICARMSMYISDTDTYNHCVLFYIQAPGQVHVQARAVRVYIAHQQ